MIQNKIIHAGWLIDGTGSLIKKNMLIHISNNYIQKIKKAEPEDFQQSDIIDFSKYTILPGLIDSHLHLFMSGTDNQAVRDHQLKAEYKEIKPVIHSHLTELVKYGIIAVRDGGDYGGYAARYKHENLEQNKLPIYIKVAGKAWRKPGRYGKLIGRPPENSEKIQDKIKAANNIDHVKIVNSGLNSLSEFGKQTPPQFDLEELKAIADAAHAKKLKVMVHCNGKKPVDIAIKAGCDSIEHGFFMGQDNLKQMADNQITWVPTAITMKAYSKYLQDKTKQADIAKRNFEHQLKQISLAKSLGVCVALGTDSGSLGVFHGKSVIQELKILINAGYSIEQAVKCATLNGANLLGLKEVGQLIPKMAPRFIGVKSDPLNLLDNFDSMNNIWIYS